MTIDLAKAKDDLYEAVNGEWLKTAKIPADRPATGGFTVWLMILQDADG